MEILGRENDIMLLEQLYKSNRPEFVAVFGRRRVGKTYLVSEVFRDRLTFYHTGLSPFMRERKNLLRDQLQAFYITLLDCGLSRETPQPRNWLEAFDLLKNLLTAKENGKRQVVFIDEMPWLDTPRSGFVSAFEHFWNGWGARQQQLMLIVCGSSTSWMKQTLINQTGGLYNRVTREIKLKPFSLHDTEKLLIHNGVRWSRFDIAQFYMIAGGVPQYINYVRPKDSFPQAIDAICFEEQAPFQQEFVRLFGSLFNNADEYEQIIRLIAKTHAGLTRQQIIEQGYKSDGGSLTTILKNLEMSDFLLKYVSFTDGKRAERYKLIDPFCRFYLTFMDKNKWAPDFWQRNSNSSKVIAWRGLAFEEICFTHQSQIAKALGIAGASSEFSKWVLYGNEQTKGTQIDMLINRADNIVNLCEMKYSNSLFTIDKNYNLLLRERMQTLMDHLPKRKMPHLTFITSFGVKQNEHSSIVQSQVTLDDLFAEA